MRRYLARLTHHKPKIRDTKDHARLIVELVDILCLQANIYLVSFNFWITSLLILFHSRLASILCQTCCVPLNHHNSNHIKLSIFITHITNTFINYYDEGGSCKFSLSGRDSDSNRFLSSWRIIPNTPILPLSGSHRVTFGTTQVQIAGKTSAIPSKILPICQEARDSNPPLDSCHWLSTHPYYL